MSHWSCVFCLVEATLDEAAEIDHAGRHFLLREECRDAVVALVIRVSEIADRRIHVLEQRKRLRDRYLGDGQNRFCSPLRIAYDDLARTRENFQDSMRGRVIGVEPACRGRYPHRVDIADVLAGHDDTTALLDPVCRPWLPGEE